VKRHTRKALLLGLGATALAVLPAAGMLWHAHALTMERSQKRLDEVAERIAARVADVLLAAEAAIGDVVYDARKGCTADLIREMRDLVVSSGVIRGVGYLGADGRIECTAFGIVDPPVAAGETTVIQPAGASLRFTPPRPLIYGHGRLISASYRLDGGGSLAVVFAPDSLLDVVPADALGSDGFAQVALHGLEMAAFGVPETRAPDFLTASRDVGVYDFMVTARASRSWALADWNREAMVTGGIGAVAGLTLAGAAAYQGRKRLSLAAELRDGLENGEFEIWYQPIVDLQRLRCSGAEALIRWRHPERDLIPPDLFIALAEETGIIIPITRWLMADLGRRLGPTLRERSDLHIGINLAPAHVATFEIVDDAKRIVEECGIRPSQVLFELTERGLIDDPACRRVVEALSDLGSEVAVDDFGTGYSSLAYIDKFRLDYLKIDKAFVSAVGDSSPAARLTDIIIEMAKSLRLKTIAEGVETEPQARYLRDRGVDFAQGWFFSKALNSDDFLEFLRREERGEVAWHVAGTPLTPPAVTVRPDRANP
jgi:sensor c-di-GMP phosphodiesterase-like protein